MRITSNSHSHAHLIKPHPHGHHNKKANLLQPSAQLPPPDAKAIIKPAPTPVNTTIATAPATHTASVSSCSNVVPEQSGDVSSCQPVPTSPQLIEQAPTLTLDELLKSWGQTESNYDFTGDGTVNVDDLLYFIQNGSWQSSVPVAEPPVLSEEPVASADIAPLPEPLSDVEPQQDLDPPPPPALNDPTPTVTTEPDPTLPSTTDPTPEPTSDPTPASSEPFTLRGLLAAWGQANAQYDITGDGTVDVNDLLQYINNYPVNSTQRADVAGGNGAGIRGLLSPENAPGKSLGHALGGIAKLTDSLINSLATAGFENQPPINIHELVDQLNLSPKQSDFVLDRLAKKYPEGLRLNVVG